MGMTGLCKWCRLSAQKNICETCKKACSLECFEKTEQHRKIFSDVVEKEAEEPSESSGRQSVAQRLSTAESGRSGPAKQTRAKPATDSMLERFLRALGNRDNETTAGGR